MKLHYHSIFVIENAMSDQVFSIDDPSQSIHHSFTKNMDHDK